MPMSDEEYRQLLSLISGWEEKLRTAENKLQSAKKPGDPLYGQVSFDGNDVHQFRLAIREIKRFLDRRDIKVKELVEKTRNRAGRLG
jgi:hypothetical protein